MGVPDALDGLAGDRVPRDDGLVVATTYDVVIAKCAALHNKSWPLLNRLSVAPVWASTTCTEPFPSPTHNNRPSLRQDTLWATSFNLPTLRLFADSTARPARIDRTFTSKPAHTASLCVGAPSAPLTRPGPKAHATTGLAKSTEKAALTLLHRASLASACCSVVGGAGWRVRLGAHASPAVQRLQLLFGVSRSVT